MTKYLDKWKTDFPASVGDVTRPTDGIDDTLDFNSDGFPQRISSDPVHYKLENDMASQLFSNDARLKEAIDANKAAGDDTLANHNKSAQSHANGIAGNAASATKLKTARLINVIGDCLTGKAASFDGSDNADIEVALATALKALGKLSPSVDKLPYFTGANAASLASLSEFMRGVLGKATAAEVRTAIGAINEPGVGVIAGDVSNANAWWVKLSGAVPLIIQGGIGGSSFVYPLSLSKVLTVAFSLNSGVWGYNWYTQDSKVNISNTAASNPKGFPYNWLVFGIG
jgi:hypothetical protein